MAKLNCTQEYILKCMANRSDHALAEFVRGMTDIDLAALIRSSIRQACTAPPLKITVGIEKKGKKR